LGLTVCPRCPCAVESDGSKRSPTNIDITAKLIFRFIVL
jgi:hypothetical protein